MKITVDRSFPNQQGNLDYSMEQLLQRAETCKTLRPGDVVSGHVAQKDRDGILVDVGTKTEGRVPAREMRSLPGTELDKLSVGDEVLVYVLESESNGGEVLLSLDRAQGERAWHSLQKCQESGGLVKGKVVDYNKGGLLVNIEGIRGFVPMSQISSVSPRYSSTDSEENPLAELVNQSLRLKVLEINRRRNRLILSEKEVLKEEREREKDALLAEIKEGDARRGVVTGIREFGAFVDIGGIDGLVHLSEFTWGSIRNPEDFVRVGDEVDVYVLKVDREARKIALSFRRLHPEPWDTIDEKYQVGQLVSGTITNVTDFGAFARLDDSIEGLIHISELSDFPVNHPREVVKEGESRTLKILRIESERRRLALSLKQAEVLDEGAPDQNLEPNSKEEAFHIGDGASIEVE